MDYPHYVSQNYRDRWSELPEGQYELKKGDIVDLIKNPGIGSLHVRREDGTDVYIAGFSGHILTPLFKVDTYHYSDRTGNINVNYYVKGQIVAHQECRKGEWRLIIR